MDIIEEWLVRKVCEFTHSDPNQTDISRDIFELGIDSFAFMDLVQAIEQKFHTRLSAEVLISKEFHSIPGIAKYLRKGERSKRSQPI